MDRHDLASKATLASSKALMVAVPVQSAGNVAAPAQPPHCRAFASAITIFAIVIESVIADLTRGLRLCNSPDSTRASFTAAIRPATTARAPADLSVEPATERGARKQSFVKYWCVSSQCSRKRSFTRGIGWPCRAGEDHGPDGAFLIKRAFHLDQPRNVAIQNP